MLGQPKKLLGFGALFLVTTVVLKLFFFTSNEAINENQTSLQASHLLKTSSTTSSLKTVEITTLKIAMPSLREETFLGWNGSSGRKFYLDPLYDYLVYIDPNTQELTPGLAIAWKISKDGMRVTLNLREGVAFNQGWGEVTAEDVKYSLTRTIDPQSRVGPASTLRQAIESIDVLNDYTIAIHLTQPDIDFVRGYLTNGQQIPILSKRYVEIVGDEEANKNPVGSGPYQLAKHRQGSSIVLESIALKSTALEFSDKNSVIKHWRVEQDFDRIQFFSVPSESTRVAMISAGEVDIAPISYDSIAKLKEIGSQILSIKQNWSPVIRMGGIVTTNELLHNPKVPWSDKRVRQALNYAIDKNLIVKAIFHGEAQSAGMDFPAKAWLDIPAYPYDPEKARQLLVEAGYPNGFKLSLNTFESSPGADLPLIGEVVAQFWQDIGIDVRIVPVDWTSLRSAIVTGKANNKLWTHRGLAFSNPAVGLHMSTSASSIFATYSDDKTELFLADIAKELDPQARDVLIKALGQYLNDQAAAVYLGFANEPFAVSPRIRSWPRISDHLTNFDLIKRHRESYETLDYDN